MNLWNTLLPLHQALSSVTHNHALSYLNKENVALIDAFNGDTAAKQVVERRIKEIGKIVTRCHKAVAGDIFDVKDFVSLKEKFSELLIFTKLASRVPTEPIPEADKKTPDFKLTLRTGFLFIEMKSLNLVDTEPNLRSIIAEALACKMDVARQVRQGKRMAMSVFGIQPYKRGENYCPDSTSAVVEALIEKVDQNIKEEQFGFGSTVLLLDFSEQLLLHGSPRDNLKREFACEPVLVPQSGELWHLAFGKLEMPMKRVVEFEGLDETDTPLKRNGILRKHEFIAGLVIHHEDKFWGAAILRDNNTDVVEFLKTICEEVAIETPDTIS